MSLVIRETTFSDIFAAPHIRDIISEYASESAIAGLPHSFGKVDMYKKLEDTGAICPIGAFLNELLVGFIIVLASDWGHYSERITIVESFFVMKEHRKTGAGLKLEQAARELAKEQKSCGILLNAPIGSSLAEVLPKIGYSETNRVFFRRISYE